MANHKSIWFSAIGAAVVSTAVAVGAIAAVPVTVAIEGRLLAKGGAPVVDGDYQLTFLLYADQTAKTPTWTETAKTLAVKAGRFQHALGSVKALTVADLDAKKSSWLSVAVAGDPELPRSPLSAVAFARRAEVADGLACSGCVDAKMLANGAVGADALAKGAVGADALAKGAVGPDALAAGAVGAAALAKGAVGAEALAKGAVKGDAVSFNWAAANKPGGVALSAKKADVAGVADVATKAKGLDCVGCVDGKALAKGAVGADVVAFNWAAADKPGGVALAATKADTAGQAAVAALASDLKCTGCVSVAEMKFDGDVDLGGNGLMAKKITTTELVAQTVVAGSLAGDGSKLTGIKIPAGMCPEGQTLTGIKVDGSLVCAAAAGGCKITVPASGIAIVQNGDASQTIGVPALGAFSMIDASQRYLCGSSTAGMVDCWGNGYYGPPPSASGPPSANGVVAVQQGSSTPYACSGGAPAQCWWLRHPGTDYGQLAIPSAVFKTIALGYAFGCGLTVTSAVACWGKFGSGGTPDKSMPSPGGKFKELKAGTDSACGIKDSGGIVCWGRNLGGILSPPPGTFSTLIMGERTACAVDGSGQPKCWGHYPAGNLQGAVSAIALGPYAKPTLPLCGIRSDATVLCAGYYNGATPVLPAGQYAKIAFGAGLCGLTKNGKVYCSNGKPSFAPAGTFQDLMVPMTSDATDVSCALASFGIPVCWAAQGVIASPQTGGLLK